MQASLYALLPKFENLGSNNLKLRDILVYATITSFYNQKDKYCYPSYRTIAKRADVSIGFVSQSVKRLKKAQLIQIWPYGKKRFCNLYRFPEFVSVRTVPLEILYLDDLTSYEKSALLILLEYMDEDYKTTLRVADLAEEVGISDRVLRPLLKAILLKGYIAEKFVIDQDNTKVEKYISIVPDLLKWFPKKLKTLNIQNPKSDDMEDILKMATKFFPKR